MLGAFYRHISDLVRGICDKTPTFSFLFYKNKAESRSLIYILNENTSLTCNIPQSLVFYAGGAEQHIGPLIPHTWGALSGGYPTNETQAPSRRPSTTRSPTRPNAVLHEGRARAPRAQVDSPVGGTLPAANLPAAAPRYHPSGAAVPAVLRSLRHNPALPSPPVPAATRCGAVRRSPQGGPSPPRRADQSAPRPSPLCAT